MKHRRAFKGLAVLPLPWSLTFFNGAPSASAAIGLPAIGGAAASVGATGLTAKLAVGLAAVAVAGGAGYETVKAVHDPAPVRPAKTTPAAIVPAPQLPAVVRVPAVVQADARVAKPKVARTQPVAKKPDRVKPAQAETPVRGRSAAAPGQLTSKPKPPRGLGPTIAPQRGKTPQRGKSATAPGRVQPIRGPKPKPPR
jgi:hypothetical protein